MLLHLAPSTPPIWPASFKEMSAHPPPLTEGSSLQVEETKQVYKKHYYRKHNLRKEIIMAVQKMKTHYLHLPAPLAASPFPVVFECRDSKKL